MGSMPVSYTHLDVYKRQPDDFDLIYERAMLAEKLGLTADMEKLLRSIISAQPCLLYTSRCV